MSCWTLHCHPANTNTSTIVADYQSIAPLRKQDGAWSLSLSALYSPYPAFSVHSVWQESASAHALWWTLRRHDVSACASAGTTADRTTTPSPVTGVRKASHDVRSGSRTTVSSHVTVVREEASTIYSKSNREPYDNPIPIGVLLCRTNLEFCDHSTSWILFLFSKPKQYVKGLFSSNVWTRASLSIELK